MSAARPQLAVDADFIEIGDQRQANRRASDRRAPRMKLDPFFAATLVNQIAKPEDARVHGYAPLNRGRRAGIVINLRA
jgi:hypothetical protein